MKIIMIIILELHIGEGHEDKKTLAHRTINKFKNTKNTKNENKRTTQKYIYKERKRKSIEAPRMPMIAHKTSCPKHDNQHCKKSKTLKAYALTRMIDIVEESKK
jgi:hypothetical protein